MVLDFYESAHLVNDEASVDYRQDVHNKQFYKITKSIAFCDTLKDGCRNFISLFFCVLHSTHEIANNSLHCATLDLNIHTIEGPKRSSNKKENQGQNFEGYISEMEMLNVNEQIYKLM